MARDETKRAIRVLCVDDNDRLREAWRRLLDLQPDFEVVGSLDRADNLLDAAKALAPHVILLDLTMDGDDPLATLARLFRSQPSARCLVCSGESDPRVIESALDAGAWGFVGKHEDPSRVSDAIRKVARGEMVIPQSVTLRRPIAGGA